MVFPFPIRSDPPNATFPRVVWPKIKGNLRGMANHPLIRPYLGALRFPLYSCFQGLARISVMALDTFYTLQMHLARQWTEMMTDAIIIVDCLSEQQFPSDTQLCLHINPNSIAVSLDSKLTIAMFDKQASAMLYGGNIWFLPPAILSWQSCRTNLDMRKGLQIITDPLDFILDWA